MCDDNRLMLAKELVVALEQGDDSVADHLLDKIAGIRETLLFKEVGRLTRQLHDTMASFALDTKISSLSEHDIPDARERLNYVISMTEQAANQTLTVVENLLPVAQELNQNGVELAAKWERFRGREMPLDEFKNMSLQLTDYFQQADAAFTQLQEGMTEILMAQGFQDITGQVIRKVIDLVTMLEQDMVGLIRMTGSKSASPHEELPGPVVPGLDDTAGDVATNQDDVDDLLSSLGF